MRKVLIITIFLSLFLLLGVVSAVEDNSTNDVVTTEDGQNEQTNIKSVDDSKIVKDTQNSQYDSDSVKDSAKVKCKVKAKAVKAYVNQKKNFNIEVSKRDGSKINKQIPLLLSIKIGKKYKNYSVRTNYQGIARFSVKKTTCGYS